ncbi:hypothetical protein HDU96_011030 [Phlyctochytrium bullatum]|nr:hypothetical protein HDU96_011030 [Phlyctochytrium bullatum]
MTTRSQFLAFDGFLRARVSLRKLRLLPHPDSSPNDSLLGALDHRDGRILMGVRNLLKETVCEQILDMKEPTQYRSLAGRYESSTRRGSGLLQLTRLVPLL